VKSSTAKVNLNFFSRLKFPKKKKKKKKKISEKFAK
jgi:hypothetical protein